MTGKVSLVQSPRRLKRGNGIFLVKLPLLARSQEVRQCSTLVPWKAHETVGPVPDLSAVGLPTHWLMTVSEQRVHLYNPPYLLCQYTG